MAALPAPLTRTDELLVAVHTELVGLRADLARGRDGDQPTDGKAEPEPLVEPSQPAATATDQVELTEPKPRRTRK